MTRNNFKKSLLIKQKEENIKHSKIFGLRYLLYIETP